MQRGAFIVLVLSALVNFVMANSGKHSHSGCGPHTHRAKGCTSACQPSCDVPEPRVCTAVCILDGCVCKEGYVRLTSNPSSPCIRRSKCPEPTITTPPPVECGMHEVPTDCTSPCESTCDTQGTIINCPNQLTANNCEPGCTCAEGYTRLDNSMGSPCVPISSCPPTTPPDLSCGSNTVRVTSGCVDYCPPTCAVRQPAFCPQICLLNGCNCRNGYIRSTDRNSPCILPSECPCTNPTTTVVT